MADLFLSKRLREERAPIAVKIKALAEKANTENRDFTAEEQGEWKSLNTAYDAYAPRIERAERIELLDGHQPEERKEPDPGREDTNPAKDRREEREEPTKEDRGTPKITEEHRALSLQAWCRRQLEDGCDLTDEHREACKLTGTNPNQREFVVKLRQDYGRMRNELFRGESRALGTAPDTAGGYTVPDGFIPNLEKALLWFGGMRRVATVRRTPAGEDLNWPTTNDTNNTGAVIPENPASATEVDVTFGQATFRAFNYTSRLVRVPSSLLQDSAFNLATELGQILGERIGRVQNTHFTTGTGSMQARGITLDSTLGVTAAAAASITADEIIDLIHSLDIAYREMGAAFMMRDSTVQHIRKLKDGTGAYLWQPGMQAGVPDRIYGYPHVTNNDVAAIASAAITVLFGVFSKYMIRDVGEVRLKRLVERYAELDQEGFVAFFRSDGKLLDAGGRPVRHLVQA